MDDMWTRQKYSLNSHLQLPIISSVKNPSNDDISWEEQAFAEDASGSLGGCMWPPRSYTCSFCRREFKSAQALGGHMNVHRRDRARLKQSPISNEILQQDHHQNQHDHCNHLIDQNPVASLGFHKFPPQISTFLNCSPNPNYQIGFGVSSLGSNQDHCHEKNFFPSNSTPDVEVVPHSNSFHKSSSCQNLISDCNLKLQTATTILVTEVTGANAEEKRNSKILEPLGLGENVDSVENDVSVSLSLVLQQKRSISPTILDGDEEESRRNSKRRRVEVKPLPLLLKFKNSIERHCVHMDPVFPISPCSKEELDLELRLGERPKVK